MKKSDINKVLKENGYGFVKLSAGGFSGDKCFTGFDGKRVKGIRGGSFGPMTVTNAYQERNQSIIREVESDLRYIGMRKNEDGLLVSEDGKIKMTLVVENFPQYARSAGYDDGYQNCYILPVFH
jgi:hypothetical protein